MTQAIAIGPDDGQNLDWGGFGVRFLLERLDTGGGFALLEHPLGPGLLAAPVHTHEDTDEYSFVLEGTVGAQVGGRATTGGPGTLIVKPRGIPHTFWNPGANRARVLEIVSPAGFEAYFRELDPILNAGGPPDPARIGALMARYRMTLDMDSTFRVMREQGVSLPGL